jgi:hypothetical protein
MVVTRFIDDPVIDQKIAPPPESLATRIRVPPQPRLAGVSNTIHREVGGRVVGI